MQPGTQSDRMQTGLRHVNADMQELPHPANIPGCRAMHKPAFALGNALAGQHRLALAADLPAGLRPVASTSSALTQSC